MGSYSQQQEGEGEAEAGESGEKRIELLRVLSRQLSLEEGDPVCMELEFLRNVYLDELEIRHNR